VTLYGNKVNGTNHSRLCYISTISKITKNYLKKFDLVMGGVHFLQVILIIVFSTDFKLPVIGSFLQFNTANQSLEPATTTLFDIPFVWLIAGFFLLSAVAHLIVATVYNRGYNHNLKNGINKARWIEYSLSASLMMVAIAMLVGVYDLGSLIMIFVSIFLFFNSFAIDRFLEDCPLTDVTFVNLFSSYLLALILFHLKRAYDFHSLLGNSCIRRGF